jgi:hypothetical protein
MRFSGNIANRVSEWRECFTAVCRLSYVDTPHRHSNQAALRDSGPQQLQSCGVKELASVWRKPWHREI